MSSLAPDPATVLEVFDSLGPPGTPMTTPEIAEEFEVTDRTIYNRLSSLVEDGDLETKKVGARGRVWWRPVENPESKERNQQPERFERMVETVNDGVYVTDGEGRFTFVNDAFVAMGEHDREELLGSHGSIFFGDRFVDTDEEEWRELVAGKRNAVEFETDVVGPDGGTRTVQNRFVALPMGQETGRVGVTRDVTERKRAKKQLAEERDMFADGPTVVFRWEPVEEAGWPVEYVSENVEDVLGYTPEEFESGDVLYTDILLEEELDRIAREVTQPSEEGSERFTHEPYRVRTKDGNVLWMKDVTKIVRNDDGEIENYLGYLVEITERKRQEESLRALQRISTELIAADGEEIADRAPSMARDVLDVEYAALWQYDEEAGELRKHASYTASTTDLDEYQFPDAFSETVWQTFISEDITVLHDREGSGDANDASLLRSRVLVPLGRHGVLCVGSHRPHTFEDRLIDLTETVAATIETAWNRAESQEQVATRNAELERLNQLNALIRGIDQAIVDGDSPAAIGQSVCERLADSERFEFAWIGERDPSSGAVVPRASAGIDDGFLENLTIPAEEIPTQQDPIIAAIQTRELQAIGDIATDPRATPWREVTLERGARSCVSIPLVYEESPYGVLTVYAEQPHPGERGKEILAELGETISYAMAAAETGRHCNRTASPN